MRIDAKGVKSYTLLEISEMSLEISGSPTLYLWICNPRGSQPRCSPPVDSEIHRDKRSTGTKGMRLFCPFKFTLW